jgi:Peptidase C13 family
MVVRRLVTFLTAGFLGLVVAVATMPAAVGADTKVAVLAFGLVGSQSVFESEAKGAAAILAQRLGAADVLVRANTKTRGDVTIAAIGATLQSAAAKLDRDNDLLVLVLTSHGSQDGVAVQAGRRLEILSPPALGAMLTRAGVRHRVVIVSACYSGVFLNLANDDTLVITAADSEHSSFGCQDKVKWTYFGDAFFNTALRRTADLRGAFEVARAIVRERERRNGFIPSNPQIAGGKNIDLLLKTRSGAEPPVASIE